jgi:undecaprenyl-phosphate 4-deoxy-4-formamido-L-arabinose transferase
MSMSIVIPVFNSATTIGPLVEKLFDLYGAPGLEIVLVDDGSRDDTASVCVALSGLYGKHLVFVQLARNFGEHNAVMAGLSQATGDPVVVMDDDFQNPPEAVATLVETIRRDSLDVVYASHRRKSHAWWRNAGSWINNLSATLLLGKPYGLYVSSFKALSRFAVGQILHYEGPFPYIDGLILQSLGRIGSVEVPHLEGRRPASSYSLARLTGLWLTTFTNFSVIPLRIAFVFGLLAFTGSLVLVAVLAFERLSPRGLPVGYLMLMSTLLLFAGVILSVTGLIGEYTGRILLNINGKPQSVVRRIVRNAEAAVVEPSDRAPTARDAPR